MICYIMLCLTIFTSNSINTYINNSIQQHIILYVVVYLSVLGDIVTVNFTGNTNFV